MSALPIIAFDTSAINALEDGGAESEALMVGLHCGFDVRVLALNVDEIVANQDPLLREALVVRCLRLLRSGSCIWPHQWVVRLLMSEHQRNPASFDWRSVNVEARGFEQALTRRLYTEEVCVEQRDDQFSKAEEYQKFWKGLRPKLDPLFRNQQRKRPSTFREAAEIARREGGVLWGIGADLFKHELGLDLSESETKNFMQACPPFLAVCYAICGSWFDWSLRPTHAKHVSVGRNDLLMATYLPYCDRFITNDWAQRRRLADIAVEARIECEVLSYRDFASSFDLMSASQEAGKGTASAVPVSSPTLVKPA